jgi:hypothetical protein
MPSNQENKGKGIKGRNDDEPSAKGLPGGTPALGDSEHPRGNRQGGRPDDTPQR